MVAMVTFNQTQTAQQGGAAVHLCWETSHFPTFIKRCVWCVSGQGAWGGSLLMSRKHRWKLDGVERQDSLKREKENQPG